MNRILATIALILLVLVVPAHARAQSPPPREDVILTEVETTNKKSDDREPIGTYSEENPPSGNEVDRYGFDKKPLEMDVSDPKSLRFMFSGAANALTPLAIQKAINPLAPKLFVSGHGRICTYRDGELLEEEELGTYRSEPVPELSEAMQLSYQLGPLLGDKYSYAPNDEGIYDFNQFKPLLITGEPPECEDTLEGTEMEAVTTGVAQTGGFFDVVLSVITTIPQLIANLFSETRGVLSSSQTGTYNEAVERYTVAQKKGDVSYLPGEVQGETEKAGGALNTFFPKQLQQYVADEEKPEGTQPQDFTFHSQPVNTNDWAANLIEQAAVKTGCMLLPKELQNKFFELGKCQIDVPETLPAGNCPIDEIAQMGNIAGNATCKLCNTGVYTSMLSANEQRALPNGIPPLMQKVLEVAGAQYRVPASILLAMMREEGAFTFQNLTWTDETTRAYSDCTVKDPIPECRAHRVGSSGASGPFGWLDWQWLRLPEFAQAVLDRFPTRQKDTISECNFVDAAFASAKLIWKDKSHLTSPSALANCPADQIYTGNVRVTSCSSWTPQRAATARLQYSDQRCTANQLPDGAVRTVNTYNALSCGR